ncbi:PREDICTED: RNA-binding motif protein, X-linked 2, partial [Acanthisitta chloris]|uniref:RNA-binding motif protein, X-linked 2 n=1 Tax=Acanthisitta chloris TaxID=57068 RepID=UPI0004F0D361
IKGRTIRVDHVANYRPPKESEDWDDVTRALHAKGCGVKTPPHTSSESLSEDEDVPVKKQKEKQRSRVERQKPSPLAGKRASTEESQPRIKIKKEKEDPGYERYASGSQLPPRGSDRNPGSRTQREEEERRHQRPTERRGDKSCQEQRGQSSSWEDREKREETGRRSNGHSSRRDVSPRGGRSWESHSRHREQAFSRDSGRS